MQSPYALRKSLSAVESQKDRNAEPEVYAVRADAETLQRIRQAERSRFWRTTFCRKAVTFAA